MKPISSSQISGFKRGQSYGKLVSNPGQPGSITMYFPSMPDSIELSRSAEYTVTSNPVLPDGIHIYKQTNPLSIPVSFKLHAFDPIYCNSNGAITLLQIAAFLESALLPNLNSSSQSIPSTPGTPSPLTLPPLPTSSPASNVTQPGNSIVDQSIVSVTAASTGIADATGFQNSFRGPPVFQLFLISTNGKTPGIKATGYVKDVKIKLNKPWLRGREGVYNLPSSADYDFTFMHVPGFQDVYSAAAGLVAASIDTQAYYSTVLEQLFNTIGINNSTNSAPSPTQTSN